jgi:hypothetical protein
VSARSRPCTSAVRSGRLRKADQFADAFELVRDYAEDELEVADVCATLAVHAGIAAADVICCARVGEHAAGENHAEAIELVEKASPGSRRPLSVLLGMKTRSGYSHEPATRDMLVKAGRAMTALLATARQATATDG